jgi:hypothetical protein
MTGKLKSVARVVTIVVSIALLLSQGPVATSKELGHFQSNKEGLLHLTSALKGIEGVDPSYLGSSCCVSVLEPDFKAIVAFKKKPTLQSIKLMAYQQVFYKVDPLFLESSAGEKISDQFARDTSQPGSPIVGSIFFDTFHGRVYFVGAAYSIDWIKKNLSKKPYFRYLNLQVGAGYNGLAKDSPSSPEVIPAAAPWLELNTYPSASPSPIASVKPTPSPSPSVRISR